jgi:hypothetical protein
MTSAARNRAQFTPANRATVDQGRGRAVTAPKIDIFPHIFPLAYFERMKALAQANPALAGGLDFFGARHVLFGTDRPFDPQGGPLFIRENIKAIDSLELAKDDLRRVCFGNAIRMLRLELPQPPARVRKGRRAGAKRPARKRR